MLEEPNYVENDRQSHDSKTFLTQLESIDLTQSN